MTHPKTLNTEDVTLRISSCDDHYHLEVGQAGVTVNVYLTNAMATAIARELLKRTAKAKAEVSA